MSPALQVDSSLSQPPGKSMNTGVGSFSLLQGIFLTQKLNWGVLYCKWILYQLSYQGSPYKVLKNCQIHRQKVEEWLPRALGVNGELVFSGEQNFCFGRTSLIVQWLGFCAHNTGDPGSIPSLGIRLHMGQLRVPMPQLNILHAAAKIQHSQINK